MKKSEILLVAVGLIAVSFLAGVDNGLNKADEATKADRQRVLCHTPGHTMDAACAVQGGDHDAQR